MPFKDGYGCFDGVKGTFKIDCDDFIQFIRLEVFEPGNVCNSRIGNDNIDSAQSSADFIIGLCYGRIVGYIKGNYLNLTFRIE